MNSASAELVTLAPGLRLERRLAPLARGQDVVQQLVIVLCKSITYELILTWHDNMADVLKEALIIWLIFVVLQVRKRSFSSSDSIGLALLGEEVSVDQDTHIFSSLWQGNGGKFGFRVRASKQGMIQLLILLCGDVHPCPGPVNDLYVPELSALLKERGMKIFHQNVRGLLLHNFGKGIDILTISETHVCAEDAEPLFDIPGYDFVCKARLTGKGEGVAAYVSDSITWIWRNDLEDEVI